MGGLVSNIKEVLRVLGEARQILPALNFKMPGHEEAISLASVFEDTVAEHADRPLLLFEGREWTYSEFNGAVNQLARVLQAQGVARGDSVALFMENRAEFILSLMAVLKLGAGCALINNSCPGPGWCTVFRLPVPGTSSWVMSVARSWPPVGRLWDWKTRALISGSPTAPGPIVRTGVLTPGTAWTSRTATTCPSPGT